MGGLLNLRRHWRFHAGILAGLVAGLVAPLAPLERLLVGADVLFVFYLVTTAIVARRLTPQMLRRHARDEDEGVVVIFALALGAVAISMVAIFDALGTADASLGKRIAALASVPLGWATLHVIFAFHYAHLWWAPDAGTTDPDGCQRGLDFGDATPEPGPTEFLYYALTIGMTAQTSDTKVTSSGMRRLTLVHAVISFFYYAVLISLAVNAGASG